MATNLSEDQLAALDIRCDCKGYRGNGHGPLCPITRANLSTERAEAAAVAAASLVHDTHAAGSADKFGSGSPRKRTIHRAAPVQQSMSMAEVAHGRVLKARRELGARRSYVRTLENEFDRAATHWVASELEEARHHVTVAELTLLKAVATSDAIADAEASV